MGVDFVDEFVEVVFMALAEVDEGLDCLVGVYGNVLLAAFLDHLTNLLACVSEINAVTYLYHVVDEVGKVSDAVVDIR